MNDWETQQLEHLLRELCDLRTRIVNARRGCRQSTVSYALHLAEDHIDAIQVKVRDLLNPPPLSE